MIPKYARDRILIVDDEANVRSLLLRHLEAEGAECVAFPSALEALRHMKRQRFSLVISDVMMPGMSGVEFLRLVKEQDPETAFIMVTGLMDINTAVDSLRTGACDFITKPFELPAIRRAVETWLPKQPMLTDCQQLCLIPRFLRVADNSACLCCLLTPVESSSPPRVHSHYNADLSKFKGWKTTRHRAPDNRAMAACHYAAA